MITNYLFIEQAIIDRLDTIAGLDVKSAADVSERSVQNATKPVAVVWFAGDQVADRATKTLSINAKYAVTYLRRSAAKDLTTSDGEFIMKIIKALEGFETPDDVTINFTGADPAFDKVNGLNEFTLNFEASYLIRW